MNRFSNFVSAALAALCLAGPAPLLSAEAAQPGFDQFVGEEVRGFATPEEALSALKAGLAAGDLPALAEILGLDAGALAAAEGIAERLADLQARAAQRIALEADGEQYLINLGHAIWTLPFPLRKAEDGSWTFDTVAGLEEIVNRRIGENELQALATVRAYVEGQRDYAAADRDQDGVLEYAQKLVSSAGATDGLYWPLEQGDGESPAGGFVDQAQFDASTAGKGYFGYHFRILTGQGPEVAGGAYDYVINDNMIAGFALVAWPVEYGRTGVNTFIVNHAGVVYEKDLGEGTEAAAGAMKLFDPDQSWALAAY